MAASTFLNTIRRSGNALLVCLLSFGITLVSTALPVFAETIEGGALGERDLPLTPSHVTASVPDIRAPSPPFLISPANLSYVTTRTPTFVWRAAIDDFLLSYYQLWIDGKLFLDQIPLISTTTSSYTIVYDPITQQHLLTIKRPLTEGTHTWKIIAYDAAGNHNSSATWSFTIDTQAPNFIIHQIGRLPVTISAYDTSTIPQHPIELLDNEPLLRGVGEPNSTITLTLVTEEGASLVFTTTVDQYGNWQIQLPILPRNQVIDLTFVIEDQAGLITVLSGVKIIILGFDLEAGIAPSPTPAQTTIEEPEKIIPGLSFIFGNFWPVADWKPEFSKRLAPIKEFVYSLLQQVAEYLPPTIAVQFKNVPTQFTQDQPWYYGWLNILIALWWPIAAFTALSIFTKGQFGPAGITQLLRALHLWPPIVGLVPTADGGWVYDAKSNAGAAFVSVHLFSLEQDKVIETVLTDKNGFFPAFSYLEHQPNSENYQHYRLILENNVQTLEFSQANPLWPSKTFASFTYFHNTYQGGIFSFRHDKAAPFWLVPVEPYQISSSQFVLELLADASDMPLWYLIWQILLTFIVVIFYTSLPNAIVVLYLLALLGARAAQKVPQYSLSVQLVNHEKQPIKQAVVFCRPIYDPTLVWICHTDKNGFARFTLTKPNFRRSKYKDQHFFIRCHQTGLATIYKKQTIESQQLTIGKTANAIQLTLKETPTTQSSCLL